MKNKKFGFVLAAVAIITVMLFTGCSRTDNASKEIENLKNKDEINEVVNKLFLYTDMMNWDGLTKEVFTPKVNLDMTSAGGNAGEVTSQSIVDGWKDGFKDLKSVHHQIGNISITIEGTRAKVICYGTATHYKNTSSGKNTRTFVGDYDIQLVKEKEMWKIDVLKFNLKFMDGNLELK